MNDTDPFRLDGRVAMVTGANVGLVARTEAELADVASSIPQRNRRVVVLVEDLSASPDIPSLVNATVEELGSLDVLVNNAGGAALLEHEGSSIVNVSSNMGHLVQRGLLVYGTVKPARSHLPLARGGSCAAYRVNAVAPSVIDTAGVSSALTEEMRHSVIAATPLGRLARPQDVAWAVVWLASRASSYVTGQVNDLDGGAHAPTLLRDVPNVDRA